MIKTKKARARPPVPALAAALCGRRLNPKRSANERPKGKGLRALFHPSLRRPARPRLRAHILGPAMAAGDVTLADKDARVARVQRPPAGQASRPPRGLAPLPGSPRAPRGKKNAALGQRAAVPAREDKQCGSRLDGTLAMSVAAFTSNIEGANCVTGVRVPEGTAGCARRAHVRAARE